MMPWPLDDHAAHQLVELMLQRRNLTAQNLELREWDLAYLAVLQCDGIAGIVYGADRVHTDDLTGHVKASDMFLTVFLQFVGLKEAGTDRKQGLKRCAGPEDMVATLHMFAPGDQAIQSVQVRAFQSDRQAPFTLTAI